MNGWAQLAQETILQQPTHGIPAWLINPMEWESIDRIAGAPAGSYRRDPIPTYRAMLLNSGCCMVDQWIPENPLSMGARGFEQATAHGATTGAEEILLDGIRIDSPEAVAQHLESVEMPRVRRAIEAFDEMRTSAEIVRHEKSIQETLGPDMLKAPYGNAIFPALRYGQYGYVNYFLAYRIFPEIIERDFSLQADLATLHNRAFARACREAFLPPFIRLDHDMAGSRGTLVDIRTLDRVWFPHFSRCLEPLRKAGIRMIWHCDGDLSSMVPRLLDVGLHGFQGFQYEEGMDYEAICRMRTRDGAPLIIIAGVSVTRTLPFGTADDVRRELRWLVEHGPETGLFLGASSSITPGVPWENLQALTEGLRHYREHGRS
jgi:hypothetical protein